MCNRSVCGIFPVMVLYSGIMVATPHNSKSTGLSEQVVMKLEIICPTDLSLGNAIELQVVVKLQY